MQSRVDLDLKTLKPLRLRTPARRLLASAKPTDKINLGAAYLNVLSGATNYKNGKTDA